MTAERETTHKVRGWWLWLQWVLASGVGMLIGFVSGFFLTGLAVEALLGETADAVLGEEGPAFYIALTVVFSAAGAGLGFLQWLVLRRRVPVAGRWVLASTLGFAVLAALFGALSGVVNEVVNEIVHNALGRAVAGTIQWRILRPHLARAGWWIPASTLGFVAAEGVSYVMGTGPEGMLAGIGAMAALTGAALVWLMNRPVRKVSAAA